MQWKGVMPAMTTPFTESLEVDWAFAERHVRWLQVMDAPASCVWVRSEKQRHLSSTKR